MDETYGLHSTIDYSDKALMSPENLIIPAEYALIFSGDHHSYPISGSTENINFPCSVATEVASINPQTEKGKPEDEHGHGSSSIKAKIASHPSYPKLLNAYLDCQKVGAPPEIASLLDEIKREYEFCKQDELSVCLGVDPELDDFMETYYDILVKYKSDISRPFDEAVSFLSKIETQLRNLCKDVGRVCLALMGEPGYGGWSKNTWTPGVYAADDGVLSTDEEFIEATEVHNKEIMSGNRELKDILLFRYGSQINNVKQGFSKKKKGKLPNDAKTTLLQWWNAHYKWPYPTEADKITLAESTGLDQKQITNWFINQRKRHWKPSENMQFTVMDNISGEFFINAD